ncbi:MAG: hypothetical protein ACI9OU_002767 [Candidatus Promineifilaceae bacterium]|jgi:hypothetical protein
MDTLIAKLVSELGIGEDQAKGGAGLLFKIAKEKLSGTDFSSLAGALGNVDDLIKASPDSGGGGAKLLGGLASAIGGDKMAVLAQLATGFSALNLDKSLIPKFATIVGDVVQEKSGLDLKTLLQKYM